MAPRLAIAVFLSLVFSFSSNAHDSDRIDKLEKEILEVKERLSTLESKPRDESDKEEPEFADEGWKSVVNWKKLATGMSELNVKRLLGDPHKVDGGKNAVWSYNNGGVVWIIDGNVDRWSEPD